MRKLYSQLLDEGAVPRLIGEHLGGPVEITFETAPAVLFDAVIIPDASLAQNISVIEFVQLQYRHDKPIMALGNGEGLLEEAGIPMTLPNGEPDPGIIVAADTEATKALQRFVNALSTHRVYARESPPAAV